MYAPRGALELNIDALRQVVQQPFSVYIISRLVWVWCPANNVAAAVAIELALAIYALCESNRQYHAQWHDACDVASLLIMIKQPMT